MENKKKVFISMPMQGLDIATINKKKDAILDELGRDKYRDISRFPDGFTLQENFETPDLAWLGMSLQFLADADCVYFADGWHRARGCKIEHECALRYGVHIIRDTPRYHF